MTRNNFDINRYTVAVVDEDKKIVKLFLGCGVEKAGEKFHKTIRAMGTKFRGYQIISEPIPLGGSNHLIMHARIL
jgi:hypothetical protein